MLQTTKTRIPQNRPNANQHRPPAIGKNAKLEALFIAKDFRGIESFTMGRRLSAEEISNAVSEYPDELVGFNRASLDIVAVQNLSPSRWSVNIRFKTMAGDSDLTVTMFMQGGPESHLYNTEILDIHVL